MTVILSRKGGGGTSGGAPTGPAGGDLSGTYPNPDIAANAVGSTEIADGAVTALKLAAGLIQITELFDSTLGADAASIDTGAGGFSTAYGHLLIVVYTRTSEVAVGSNTTMTFNNDGGANYDEQSIRNINTTVSGPLALAGTSFTVHSLGASAQAGAFASGVLFVPAYGQTTGHKSVLSMVGRIEDTAADAQTLFSARRWRSTVAVSRVILAAASGNLVAGSRLSVYGIG